jgi:MFS family permease
VETVATATTERTRLPLFALLAANAFSLVGSALTAVALPWFVLVTTGSAGRTGLTGAVLVLPSLLTGLFGGALVDRIGFKRMSVVADLVSGAGIAAIPLLYHTVGLAFWQLLTLVFVGHLLDVSGITARRSLLPELAGLAGIRLERINAAYEANQQLAFLLGPPLAGLLIAWLGASNVLWLDAATFALSALAIGLAVPAAVHVARRASGRYVDELRAGLRFLRRDRVLLALAVSLGVTNFFGNPLVAVLLPVYAREWLGGSTDLGLLLGAFGVGALAGIAAYGWRLHRLPRRALWIGAYLIEPVLLWALLPGFGLWPLVAIMALVAFTGGPVNPLAVTVRHERIPAELRGRVFSTFSAIAMSAAPLGIAVAGFLVEAIGFRPTVVLLASGLQLAAVGMFFVPAFRELDRRRTSV